MAYVSQELKSQLSPQIKSICKKYGLNASVAVDHNSTLVLNIKSGTIDFIRNFNRVCALRPRPEHLPFQPATDSLSVNTYWYHEHFDGAARAFLDEIVPAMKGPDFFDDTDISSDYFNCSHYISVNIGKWNKPYTHLE